MPEIVTRRVGRDRLQSVFRTHEMVKLMESLVLDVSENLPGAVVALADRTAALELGVFGRQEQPVRDVRAGEFISISEDAVGYIVSIDIGQLLIALDSSLTREDIQAPPVNDAQAVLAGQIFGA